MAARHTRWKGLHNSSVWRLRRPFILSQGRRKREEGEGKKRAGHEDRGKKGRGEEPTGAGKGKASREKGEKLRKSEAREEAGQGRREWEEQEKRERMRLGNGPKMTFPTGHSLH